MLSFARRQELKLEPVDTVALVKGLQGLLERTLGPSLVLSMRAIGNVHPARTDANQLELAIINLAVNARDAMPNGGRLVVSTAVVEWRAGSIPDGSPARPGRFVRLVVADNGGWGAADAVLANASFAANVDVIGVHYPSGSNSTTAGFSAGTRRWSSNWMRRTSVTATTSASRPGR